MNNFSGIGRLGNDAELRFTADKTPIASFSIAIAYSYGKNAITSWVNCSLFGKRAETLVGMLLKGTQIGINGEIALQEYTDKQGNEKNSLICNVREVTLLGKKETSEPKEDSKANSYQPQNEIDAFEDDVPF